MPLNIKLKYLTCKKNFNINLKSHYPYYWKWSSKWIVTNRGKKVSLSVDEFTLVAMEYDIVLSSDSQKEGLINAS